jgi:two-component system, NarL family, nitrate/nitrite response regulator NarL
MRALWVEDHQLIGDSLELLLQVVMPQVSLDKASSLPSALRLVEEIHYELVLMDWWLGQQDGELTLSGLRDHGCQAPVIVVSGDESENVRQRALALGASHFVSKASDPMTLVAAIRSALPGESAHDVSLPSVRRRDWTTPDSRPLEQIYPTLTARQIEVFKLLMHGRADKEIGRDLGIAESTVKSHVQVILQEVGVRRRGEAVHAARSRGVREV